MSTTPFYLRRPQDDLIPRLPLQDGSQDSATPAAGIVAPKLNAPKMAAPSMQDPNNPKTPLDLDTMAHQQEKSRLEQYGVGERGAPIQQIRSPFARTLARIGDVAGSVIAPGLMASIPGTTLHHEALINQQEQALGQNAKLAETGARAAHEQAQGELANAQAADLAKEGKKPLLVKPGERVYNEATGQVEYEAPAADAANKYFNVPPGHSVIDTSGKVIYTAPAAPDKEPTNAFALWRSQNPNAPVTDWLKLQEKPAQSEYADFKTGYLKQHPNANETEVVKAYAAAHQAPQQPPQAMTYVPGPNGTVVPTIARPGVPLPAGAMNIAGVNSLAVPTAATRQMAEKAPRVIHFVDRMEQLINENEQQLGPLKGRWAEFTAGKVGLPNRGYTQLRTDAGLLSTALMNMHVGARGGELMMEHFQNLINQAIQDPDNLRAALGEIKAYAQQVQGEGAPKQTGGGGDTLPGGITMDDINKEIERRKKAKK